MPNWWVIFRHPRLESRPGNDLPKGIPLKRNEHVIEAVRVSGGMGEQDQAGAETGAKQGGV
jgi:uncharacterized protein GlcG (DUF336 family)